MSTTTPSSRPNTETLFSFTSRKWLCNNEQQLKKRYSPFNVDALENIACRAVGARRCLSWEKIGEGSFNSVFLLRFDNDAEVAVRVPCPIVANVEQTIASEVATMCYVRDRWSQNAPRFMPLPPKVLAWNGSYQNPAGIPYIIAEYASGVTLQSRWDHIQGDDAAAALNSILAVELALLYEPFSHNGSLYFVEDVDEDLHGRPLYPPESPKDLPTRRSASGHLRVFRDDVPLFPQQTLSTLNLAANDELYDHLRAKYRIGPTTNREWWRGEYAHVPADRGPWPDMPSMLRSAAEFQLRALDLGVVDLASPSVKSNPSDASLLRRLLTACLRIAPFIGRRDPTLTMPVLKHPDISLDNLIVSPNGPAWAHSLIDWQGATVSPYCIHSALPPAVIYSGPIPIPSDGSMPPWPDNFDEMPQELQDQVRVGHRFACRHRGYAIGAPQADYLRRAVWKLPYGDALLNIVPSVTRCIADGPSDLRGFLIAFQKHWDTIADEPCPIGFTEEEIAAHHEQEAAEAEYANIVTLLYDTIGCADDGSVRAENYDKAKAVTERYRAEWDEVEMKGPFPIYEGAHSHYLS